MQKFLVMLKQGDSEKFQVNNARTMLDAARIATEHSGFDPSNVDFSATVTCIHYSVVCEPRVTFIPDSAGSGE